MFCVFLGRGSSDSVRTKSRKSMGDFCSSISSSVHKFPPPRSGLAGHYLGLSGHYQCLQVALWDSTLDTENSLADQKTHAPLKSNFLVSRGSPPGCILIFQFGIKKKLSAIPPRLTNNPSSFCITALSHKHAMVCACKFILSLAFQRLLYPAL